MRLALRDRFAAKKATFPGLTNFIAAAGHVAFTEEIEPEGYSKK